MEAALSITPSEQSHCNRFCFNGGSCFECARDPYGLAQCLGCICPQHLWTGERCELRIGHGDAQSSLDTSLILACLFGAFTLLLSCLLIYLYFKIRKSRPDPLIIPIDQQLSIYSTTKTSEIDWLPPGNPFESEVGFVVPKDD